MSCVVALLSVHTSQRCTQIASTTLLLDGDKAGCPAVTKDLKNRKGNNNDSSVFLDNLGFLN